MEQDRRRATAMTCAEMVYMVQILEKHDYDGRKVVYQHANTRKDGILTKIVEGLNSRFRVLRTKDQLRKRWSDLKLREREQLNIIHRIIKKKQIKKARALAKRNRRQPSGDSAIDLTDSTADAPAEVAEVAQVTEGFLGGNQEDITEEPHSSSQDTLPISDVEVAVSTHYQTKLRSCIESLQCAKEAILLLQEQITGLIEEMENDTA
ncbi:uncharacterized protein LOC108715760 [Xenopus laevis]|uniref:Uncharacterized protein n=2 Tax=Xenopus laevis TaxID=8355 RepID=A0A974D027_XENLA|nr:uncharacterized protein LOC108715760 [Xenopus laevis]OCT83099.1 hypothetical protein XELAEV_18025638mg [Xenopus laevis]